MPANIGNGGPPRRVFQNESQDYEEGHFQHGRLHNDGHGQGSSSGWKEVGSSSNGDAKGGDDFLGLAKTSGVGIVSGLEKRGSASARHHPSSGPQPPAFNSYTPGRRAPSPALSSPLGSVMALIGSLKTDLLSSSSTGVVGNIKFVSLCCLWYFSSALSSNTGKSIFMVFKFPVTLTLIQFAIISFYCFVYTRPALKLGTLREPTKALLRGVLPMAAFQVGGHVFSSVATSRVPVATVHTIKALSPLFTVLSYRFLFGVSYSASTYVALVPLTLGVMFACSFDISASNYFGLICAFGSTLVFVSSNIFFKKIVPSNTGASAGQKDATAGTNQRLDKINLLFYSSSLAFLFMVPLWFYSDLLPIITESRVRASMVPRPPPRTAHILYYLFLNGTSHFLQNVLAFNILSSTSPVTYSIASLIKRIFVIVMAIVWFRQKVHLIQGLGIGLTFVGLYMYQSAKGEVASLEKKVRKIEAIREGSFLPSSTGDTSLFKQERENGHLPGAGGLGSFGGVEGGESLHARAPSGPPPQRLYPQQSAKAKD